MDVDDTVLEFFRELRCQNLHVAGEDDGIRFGFFDDFAETVFGNRLVRVGRHVVERDAKGTAYRAQVWVITDDATEFAGKVSIAALEEQVVKAMVGLRYEYGYAFGFGRVEKFPIQLKMRSNGLEVSFDFGNAIGFNVKYRAQEKCFDILGGMLLEVNNISSGFGKNLRCAGNKPFLVGTEDLKYVTSHRHTIILKNLGHVTKYFISK